MKNIYYSINHNAIFVVSNRPATGRGVVRMKMITIFRFSCSSIQMYQATIPVDWKYLFAVLDASVGEGELIDASSNDSTNDLMNGLMSGSMLMIMDLGV